MEKCKNFTKNYHTHTNFCKHAKYTMEEMIIAAIDQGYELIGFSEHAPLRIHRMFRLNLSNLNEYLSLAQKLKAKYAKQIKVLIGLECEYHEDEHHFYQWLHDLPEIDYLIFGNHNNGNPMIPHPWSSRNVDFDVYCKQLETGFKSKLFACLAHPDYIISFYGKWDQKAIKLSKKIIDLSIKYDMPLGFNLNGFRFKKNTLDYPCDEFWKLVASSNAKVIVEADAHSVNTLQRSLVLKALEFAKTLGINKNIIDTLKIK